jgi:predicted nuclease of predicted toxin-antitoxin system
MNNSERDHAQLRNQGHDAIHLRDQGLHGMPNGKIFENALREDRVVLTSDFDFREEDLLRYLVAVAPRG